MVSPWNHVFCFFYQSKHTIWNDIILTIVFGIIKNQVCVIYIEVFLLRKLRNIQWDDCAKYNLLWIHITLQGWSDFLIIPLIPTSVYWRVEQSVYELVHSTQFCWTGRSLAINVTTFQSCKIPRLKNKSNETIGFNVPRWNQSHLCCAWVTNCLCNSRDDSTLKFWHGCINRPLRRSCSR